MSVRESFEYESRYILPLLRAFCDSKQADDWLFYLAVIGQPIGQHSPSLSVEAERLIILADQAAGTASLQPWKGDQDTIYTGATAYQCAAIFLHDVYNSTVSDYRRCWRRFGAKRLCFFQW